MSVPETPAGYKYAHIIGGKPAFSDSTVAIVNPATGLHLGDTPIASAKQLEDTIDSARSAFSEWSSKSYDERAHVLVEIARVVELGADDYKKLLTAEQGKPHRDALIEIMGSVYWFRETAKLRLQDTVQEDTAERTVVTQHVALGVAAAIVPWNFPILLAAWKIAPALLAGNTVIVKPSPFTPLTTLRIIADVQKVVPPGVLSVLSGDHELGPLMTAHPGIDKIAFTGSSQTGKQIIRSASYNMTRFTLELGGNDPMIILPEVDPEIMAPHIFWGAFSNNGQFCIAAKRIYIHESVYERVRDALVAYARKVVVGNGAHEGTQVGPVQNKPLFDKLRELFEDTRARGCKFALGGEFPAHSSAHGLFVPISIVDNPPEDARIVQEEQFGPIVPLLRWSDEEDVVRRANATQYGLAASVWGNDLRKARRIAGRIEAGNVWVNEIHKFGPTIPGGGHKHSGIGVENGVDGLAHWTNLQTISINKGGIAPI
ncbi:aldehyde dehydrogenase family protein [Ceratobasidium sp. AG-Ba]|nr:aldehyde dehydrogenase family protein [Ceratobasidium sp. AG-Ba]QRW02740.1 aldehyde dehydrogenase family protein [Ceratobasidium sp. AG-Ba]